MGHSLGGALAAQALADDPDFAKRVVLLDPVFEIPDGDFEAVLADQLAERDLGAQELTRSDHPRYRLLAGAGHSLHRDDPRAVLEALDAGL